MAGADGLPVFVTLAAADGDFPAATVLWPATSVASTCDACPHGESDAVANAAAQYWTWHAARTGEAPAGAQLRSCARLSFQAPPPSPVASEPPLRI